MMVLLLLWRPTLVLRSAAVSADVFAQHAPCRSTDGSCGRARQLGLERCCSAAENPEGV